MPTVQTTFSSVTRSRFYPNYWDGLALLFVLSVILFFAWNARQMATPYQIGQVIPISLHPALLPSYAARTVARMLIALVISLIFTFIFGTWAAKNRRAERIIIPVIDILQSVPILGFSFVTVPIFIGLFPGSLLGPECAAIFVIFTSQAWNMALGFYQTVRSVPAEIMEAARMLQLSSWQRFWRIEVPYSMPGLLWNAMASMSAGWFFVVATEAITVSHQSILLPGIGSFIAVAIQTANIRAIVFAVLTMFVVILFYDQLLFRPLVAWSEKFKAEQQAADKVSESWVINFFRRTRLTRDLGSRLAALFENYVVNIRIFNRLSLPASFIPQNKISQRWVSLFWNGLIAVAGLVAFVFLWRHISKNITLSETIHVFGLGLITALRVFILIILCSLIWIPIGVWIGLRPRVRDWAAPAAQILSAFPANLFYPFIVIFIVEYQLNSNIWLTPLMILGSQWYILFNVIAGAAALPKDLLQVADNLNVTGWLRWSRLLLPGIFPYFVTGAMTAAGGAWNASIVAEVVSWGSAKLEATGLGAYITRYTDQGDFFHTALGIGMMCILVLLFNRLLWRPLYLYAENRFLLE